MFSFKGVHHIAISVPSLAQAKDFYVNKLGLSLVDESELPPSPEADAVTGLKETHSSVLMVSAGNIFLEIFEFHQPRASVQEQRPVCDHGYTHFAFEVENIETAYQELKAAGVQWHCAPIEAGEGYLMTYGRDPFGNVIEIQQLQAGTRFSFEQLQGKQARLL